MELQQLAFFPLAIEGPTSQEPQVNHAAAPAVRSGMLERIGQLDAQLFDRFRDRTEVTPSFTRQIVSFQHNKQRPAYRWYKYKEAFSAGLVEYVLDMTGTRSGRVLDPFAGSGTTLFAATERGLDADGIELLPVGQELIAARLCLEREFRPEDIARLQAWEQTRPWRDDSRRVPVPTLKITEGAYPAETETLISHYLAQMESENERVRRALRFALFCVLEDVSFTRKDGQYLRWDYRSGRQVGAKPFDKGRIVPFEEAIAAKLLQIIQDLSVPSFGREATRRGTLRLLPGSCLAVLPSLPSEAYDLIVTSPPYCNRYDYTRTYALELTLLGVSERQLVQLRQDMVSCTIENRAKDLLLMNREWRVATEAADRQALLQEILDYLDSTRVAGALNNNGIPRMVRGYFYEMACVIVECARVLRPDARVVMVNDNVRYAGASISVDLILAALAEELGFSVEKIMVLEQGKGNSSQQMGEHGRAVLRKCVYVWRKV